MAQLRQDYQQFTARGAEIVVVNPEDAAEVKAFSENQGLPFRMLVDPGHEVANRYGQEVNLFKLGRMPALVVLDRAGMVQYDGHREKQRRVVCVGPIERRMIFDTDESGCIIFSGFSLI